MIVVTVTRPLVASRKTGGPFRQRGSAEGEPDLLVVHPALGVLAGDVEPVRRGPAAGPRDRGPLGLHVEPREGGLDAGPGERQHLDGQRRRDAPGHADPFFVGPLDQLGQHDEVAPASPGLGVRLTTETAEIVADQVKDEIVDAPARTRGRAGPTGRLHPGQELEQPRSFPGQQRMHVKRRQVLRDVPAQHHRKMVGIS